MKKQFASRGLSRMIDAFTGAPRGSIKLTAEVVNVKRNLANQAVDSAALVDIGILEANFNHVVDGDIEVDGSDKDYQRNLEDLEYRVKNACRFLNRIRTTAIKAARFRKTGDVR